MIARRTRTAIAPNRRRQVQPVDHLNNKPSQMLLRKPFVQRRRQKKSGLAVDRAEIAHQCSAQAVENQFHNDSLCLVQTVKSDRLLGPKARLPRTTACARSWSGITGPSYCFVMVNFTCPATDA